MNGEPYMNDHCKGGRIIKLTFYAECIILSYLIGYKNQ
jgi:hypothetical protein